MASVLAWRHRVGTIVSCLVAALLLAGLAAGAAAAAETVIRVRADALRTASETHTALAAALGEARRHRHFAGSGGGQQIVIELEPGRYRVTRPIELTENDSGSPGAPLILRTRGGGTAVLSGAAPLLAITTDPRHRATYPAVAQPHLVFYALPDEMRQAPHVLTARRFDRRSEPPAFEVFDAHGRLWPARWPNEGWARSAGNTASREGRTFDSGGWIGEIDGDVWLSGFPGHDWAYEVSRIASREAGTGLLSLQAATSLGLAAHFRFAIQHSRSDLDAAGEWHRDAGLGVLALWPRPGGGAPEISVARSLLELNGVRHVKIEGLVLERARGDAIHIRGGSDIALTGITTRHVGGWAVAFEGARESFIAKSRVSEVGEGGVILSGGDRLGLVAANLRVENTLIEGFGRLGLSHRPAISLHGVGNTARANRIADGPHTAIDFTGNDHWIESNEISNVVRETGDAGAIYTGRDWTARGTVIRRNFLHDIHGHGGREVKGVYLDDLASGIRIEGNLFLRVEQAVFIGGGSDNSVARNLFVAAAPAIHLDGRGLTWARDMVESPSGALRQRLAAMPVTASAWRHRYPDLALLLADAPGTPKRNRSAGNVVIGGAPYRLLPEVERRLQDLEPMQDLAPSLAPDALTAAIGASRASELARLLPAPLVPPELALADMDRGKPGAPPPQR